MESNDERPRRPHPHHDGPAGGAARGPGGARRACSAMYLEAGFDGAEVPARSPADSRGLARKNSVRVAEANHVVAGFLAWHDESPGVAYLVDIQVHPEFQRFGIAADLLDALKDEARKLKLEQIVVRAGKRRAGRWGSTAGSGSSRSTPPRPPRCRGGRRSTSPPASQLVRPGEVALWAPSGRAEDRHGRRDGHDAAHRRNPRRLSGARRGGRQVGGDRRGPGVPAVSFLGERTLGGRSREHRRPTQVVGSSARRVGSASFRGWAAELT